jgi:hypothetical protein
MPERTTNIVKMFKRYISQRCIGYQKNQYGDITHYVGENRVEWQDGTISTIWSVVPTLNTPGDHTAKLFEGRPRIDVANPQI